MTTIDNDAAVQRHTGNGVMPRPTQATGFLANASAFFEMAETLSKASIIPADFRNQPANVFVALEMAHRLGIGPLEAMQNIYVVHGTPSLSAKFLIGLANRSGRFRGGLRFREEGAGESLAVTCHAIDRETGEEFAVKTSMAQAREAKWAKNAKYREMPEQMLSYRAATFFVRRYCPEVMLGMPTVDEAEEMPTRETQSAVVTELQAQIDESIEAETTNGAPADTSAPIGGDRDPSAPPPAYAPEIAVAKVVAAFEALGVRDTVLNEEFGRLDRLDEATFARLREYGTRIKDGTPIDAVFESEGALTLLAAGAKPDAVADEAEF